MSPPASLPPLLPFLFSIRCGKFKKRNLGITDEAWNETRYHHMHARCPDAPCRAPR